MRLVHKVAAGNFKGDAHQPKEETVFLAEGEVIDAFCRNDAGLAEALLASGTLQEILGGIPTLNTLAPGVAADMNPLSAPPVGGMDEIASYTAPDEPDCDEALPAPPLHLRAPRSSARQTVHLRPPHPWASTPSGLAPRSFNRFAVSARGPFRKEGYST